MPLLMLSSSKALQELLRVIHGRPSKSRREAVLVEKGPCVPVAEVPYSDWTDSVSKGLASGGEIKVVEPLTVVSLEQGGPASCMVDFRNPRKRKKRPTQCPL